MLTSTAGGIRLYSIQLLVYIAPIFAGGVLVFFMVKPLFAGRAPRAQPLALHPGQDDLGIPVQLGSLCKAEYPAAE